MTAVDVFSTANCPTGHRCESCGDAAEDLVAATAETALGVLCLTLCQRCGDADMAPPVAVGTAVKLVMQHCLHLGITADEMAAALEESGTPDLPRSLSRTERNARVVEADPTPRCVNLREQLGRVHRGKRL